MTGVVPLPDQLAGVSVILPVVTETDSLDETVRILQDLADSTIEQLLIVVCDRTTPESLARCQAAKDVFGARVQIHHQTLPYLGGAMREAFLLATASHTIIMASDLETDPAVVPALIAVGRDHPGAIVTASRWVSGGGFSGYGPVRVALNWTFQHLASLIYRTKLTDATYGYRLFPTSLLHAVRWEGLKHELLLETVLKPVRLGIPVFEVAASWAPRSEGDSQNSIKTQVRYVRILFRERFRSTNTFLNQKEDVA